PLVAASGNLQPFQALRSREARGCKGRDGKLYPARSLLGDRLTVGPQTLTLVVYVRILVPQPLSLISSNSLANLAVAPAATVAGPQLWSTARAKCPEIAI